MPFPDGENNKKQPVFIFGTWRSGSTLLQRILNSYGDVLILGEHVGFWNKFASAFFNILNTPENFNDIRPWGQLMQTSDPLHTFQSRMQWWDQKDWWEILRAPTGKKSSFEDEGFNHRWKTVDKHLVILAHEVLGYLNQTLGYSNPPLPISNRILGQIMLLCCRLRKLLEGCRKVFLQFCRPLGQ